MRPPVEQFRWLVPTGGYAWEDAETLPLPSGREPTPTPPGPRRLLVERPMAKPGYRQYGPLWEFPMLYDTFASLEPTEDAFLEFANKYGDLGVGLLLRRSGPILFCDPLSRWQYEHTRLRDVIDVVRAIRSGDGEILRQWFFIEREHAYFSRKTLHGESGATIAAHGPSTFRDWLWRWAKSADTQDVELMRFATGWAQDQINRVLTGGTTEAGMTTAQVLFDRETQQMGLHVVPRSLLGALWYQCAQALVTQAVLRECRYCGNLFDVSQKKRPKRVLYCSTKCKLAMSRAERKKREAESDDG